MQTIAGGAQRGSVAAPSEWLPAAARRQVSDANSKTRSQLLPSVEITVKWRWMQDTPASFAAASFN